MAFRGRVGTRAHDRKASSGSSNLRAWIVAILALAVAVWFVATSQPFQNCTHQTDWRAVQSIDDLATLIGSGRECLGLFLHDSAEEIIAIFTIILAISTSLLWCFTRAAAYAAKAAADHIPRVERAYVFGGGPIQRCDADGKPLDPPELGWVSVGNYGKTPAILKKVEWGFCDEDVFPTDRPVSEILNRRLLPKEMREAIKTQPREDVLRAGDGPKPVPESAFSFLEHSGRIFFGRFTYSVLFDDQEHFSTFKLKLGSPAGSVGLPGSYTDWN
jgi:hypothetical protein